MDPERWARVEALFHRCRAVEPQGRRALLDGECAGDGALRALVERMLRDDAGPSALLDASAGALVAPASDPNIGREVGAYRLTARVGAGGMGVVYRAARADGLFERDVAVKLVRSDLPSEATLRRFERERRTLAALAHPNIARLLDGGTTSTGAPYFVMELVEGLPIDRYCARARLTVRARVRLFALVCRAVHFAHTNLVVHSDLKPGNILVDASGAPKLLDFGVARLLQTSEEDPAPSARTLGPAALTPEYASPEQLAGAALTTASDVYSLGVVLYGLLTGRRPVAVDSPSRAAWERVVGEVRPSPPSESVAQADARAAPDLEAFPATCGVSAARLRRQLAGDLDRIVLMALRKEPERRYPSAQALAADLERHLEGRPVLARGDSALYLTARFVRRHRVVALASLAVATALLAGAAVALRGQRLARAEAEHARIEADSSRDLTDFLLGDLQTSLPARSAVERGLAVERALREAEISRTRYARDPHRLANVLDGLGRVCLQLAADGPAEELLEEGLALRTREFGPRSLEVALSVGSLGELAYRRGEYALARERFERALDLHRSLPRSAHTDVARAANDLAVALRASGELDAAETLHREALALRRARPGAELLVAESLNNLAGVHLARGELDDALRSFEESLALRRAILGPGHPLTLQSQTNLANPLWRVGETARARQLFEDAESGYRALGGNGAEGLALVQSALASLDLVAADPAGAARRLEEALTLRIERLGVDHPDVAALHAKLAEVLHALGEHEAAGSSWAEALRGLRAAFGAQSPAVGRVLRSQAVCLMNLGRHDQAQVLLDEARATLDPADASERADAGRVELCLGLCLAARGDRTGAGVHLREAVALLADAPGAAPAELERARLELAAHE